MPGARYTLRAEADLEEIASYTRQMWGSKQEFRYLAQLERCCDRLAASPLLGRACDELLPGLRRMEQARHVVFYLREGDGILVARVLHQAMLPSRWEMTDDEQGVR